MAGQDPSAVSVTRGRLTDPPAALAVASEVGTVAPERLEEFELLRDRWRAAANLLAPQLDPEQRLYYLRIVPVETFEVPDTDDLDAVYDAADRTRQLVGYRLEVVEASAARAVDVIERTPIIHARVAAMRHAREAWSGRVRGPLCRRAGWRRAHARSCRPGRRRTRRVRARAASDDPDLPGESFCAQPALGGLDVVPRARPPPPPLGDQTSGGPRSLCRGPPNHSGREVHSMSLEGYANEADGYCQQCGAETTEPWHAYCPDCFATQEGWTRPGRGAIEAQHEARSRVSLLALVERVAALERSVVALDELVVLTGQALELAAELAGELGRRVEQIEHRRAA
jgi:hypothetical protein